MAVKVTLKEEPIATSPRLAPFPATKLPLRSYCQTSKPYNLSGLAVANGSSGTVIVLVPPTASSSSASPTHKDTSTALPPPVDGRGESRRSSQLDTPDIDTIDIMINTAFCNFIPMTSIPARAFSLLHFTFFYLKVPVSFLRRKRQ